MSVNGTWDLSFMGGERPRAAEPSGRLLAQPHPVVIKGVLHARGKIPSPAVRLPLLPARHDTASAAMSLLAAAASAGC